MPDSVLTPAPVIAATLLRASSHAASSSTSASIGLCVSLSTCSMQAM
jgi:hypothetical protein